MYIYCNEDVSANSKGDPSAKRYTTVYLKYLSRGCSKISCWLSGCLKINKFAILERFKLYICEYKVMIRCLKVIIKVFIFLRSDLSNAIFSIWLVVVFGGFLKSRNSRIIKKGNKTNLVLKDFMKFFYDNLKCKIVCILFIEWYKCLYN